MSMFINREYEIKALDNILSSEKPELVLVYGRRRVGKSRLLLESIKKRKAIYFLADMSKNILEVLAKQTNEKFVKFSNWDDFFQFIYESDYNIFVIDEFQYLYNVDKSWPTIMQRWWEKIKTKDKKIILCGSIISTIYKITRSYGSALYGRKTFEFDVKPLTFWHIKGFFNYDVKDMIIAYSVLGGVPRYLEEFDPKKQVTENVREKILEKVSFLYNEPMNLLYEEFRDATPYVSIILAIVQGSTKFNEISLLSRIDTNKLPKYLNVLERVEIITKEIPITERKMKSKITRYKVIDNFYRFWFKFVFPNKSRIEQQLTNKVLEEIKKELDVYVSFAFEDICKEIVIKDYAKVGGWWHKENEIDIVALNEDKKEILFAECKWSKEKIDSDVYRQLKEKSRLVDWHRNKRIEKFALFSKSGFTQNMIEIAKKEKVSLFDLNTIERLLV